MFQGAQIRIRLEPRRPDHDCKPVPKRFRTRADLEVQASTFQVADIPATPQSLCTVVALYCGVIQELAVHSSQAEGVGGVYQLPPPKLLTIKMMLAATEARKRWV